MEFNRAEAIKATIKARIYNGASIENVISWIEQLKDLSNQERKEHKLYAIYTQEDFFAEQEYKSTLSINNLKVFAIKSGGYQRFEKELAAACNLHKKRFGKDLYPRHL